MYSAIILSVNGVISKLSRPSSLLMVLLSDLTAITLNLAELVFLFCFINKELHVFDVMGLAWGEDFVILICHCVEGAKICAMLCSSALKMMRTPRQKMNQIRIHDTIFCLILNKKYTTQNYNLMHNVCQLFCNH